MQHICSIIYLHLIFNIKVYCTAFQIIAARQLTRTDNKALSSPFVEIEIIGADFDCQKYRTSKYIRK